MHLHATQSKGQPEHPLDLKLASTLIQERRMREAEEITNSNLS